MPGIPRLGFCVVDVRDVLDLHIRAMTAPEAAGERFIAAEDWVWMADVSRVLLSELDADARSVPTRKLPDFVLRIVALLDRQMQFMTPLLGRKHPFNADKARAELGWKPRPAAATIIDCAQSLIATAPSDQVLSPGPTGASR